MHRTPVLTAALIAALVGAIALGSATAAAADDHPGNRGWDTSSNRGWDSSNRGWSTDAQHDGD